MNVVDKTLTVKALSKALDGLEVYPERKGMSLKDAEKWLATNVEG
jgi:hypothetical protein